MAVTKRRAHFTLDVVGLAIALLLLTPPDGFIRTTAYIVLAAAWLAINRLIEREFE
jgi:hypothetical protein